MFEKSLHAGNIAASFAVVATAADLTFSGGAASTIGACLSGVSLWKSADKTTKGLAEEMAKAMDASISKFSLSEDRKRITAQMLSQYPPDENAIVSGNLDAATIAASLRGVIEANANDPAHQSPRALSDFTEILTATLVPFLAQSKIAEQYTSAILKELLKRTDRSGEFERMRGEGITEKAIIRLAQRIASDTDDIGTAWVALQDTIEAAVQVQRDGQTTSNHGDFIDRVLRRVATFAADGGYSDANAEIDAALLEEEAAHKRKKVRLINTGIEVARLDGNARRAAQLLVAKLRTEVTDDQLFGALRVLQDEWYVRGRDAGLRYEATVAIHLAEATQQLANTTDDRGKALNDLGNTLQTLGERESGTARLEEAVAAYHAALEELTRDRVPLNWAATQNNLGAALNSLGERESGTAQLEEAVAAYRAALEEYTRENVPLEWATTQNNLGNALRTLGERGSGTARLEEAVAAHRAALEEWTRDKLPLDWAMTQNNLGNALDRLGTRESGTARLEEAVAAYRAALEERTRDRVPFQWAKTHQNLAIAEIALFEKMPEQSHLDAAKRYANDANEVFVEVGATHNLEKHAQIMKAIAALRKAAG